MKFKDMFVTYRDAPIKIDNRLWNEKYIFYIRLFKILFCPIYMFFIPGCFIARLIWGYLKHGDPEYYYTRAGRLKSEYRYWDYLEPKITDKLDESEGDE